METSNSYSPQSPSVVDAILIVDDEPMILSLAEQMISRIGFAALKAKNGMEAVEVFKKHKNVIRCVLCDVYMPHMDGWETLSRLRQIEPRIPVILCSGSINPSQALTGDHTVLPQAFLSKPFGKVDLHGAIIKALEGAD